MSNTNINPYFDDFDATKNYQQVLFKSGLPIQARELNNIQSILHNQIKNLSDTNYKNGDLISGGELSYDRNLDTVLLQNTFNNNSIDKIANTLIGKTIRGNSTGILATVVYYLSGDKSSLALPTLYIKYTSSGKFTNGIQYTKFADNEILSVHDVAFAKTITPNATQYTSSILHVNNGIFYWDGYYITFVSKGIILEQYNNTANLKVGVEFKSKFITAQDDQTLTNNSRGLNNYAVVGADRLQITAELRKIPYNEPTPTNFTELIKIKNGEIEYSTTTNISNQITTAIANRTYEQSGNFTIKDFKLTIKESLNNLFNDGVYDVGDVVKEQIIINKEPDINETNKINGNNYVSVELSPGIAIVKGYNHNYQKSQLLNIEKARNKSEKLNNQLFVDCGSYLTLYNTSGILDLTTSFKPIQLYDKIFEDVTKKLIGTAKAVSITYENDKVRLYVIDFSTHTNIAIAAGSNVNLSYGDYVEGSISGASGYVYSYTNTNIILENNTGNFVKNEPLINSRNGIIVNIVSINNYAIDNIKSVASTTGFFANVTQDQLLVKGNNYTVTGNTIVGNNTNFQTEFNIGSTITIGNIIGTITSIPNNNTIVTDTAFTNQSLNSLYKLITVLKSNNKNLFVSLPNKNVNETTNKTFTIIKSASVTFSNGEAILPNQNNNELSFGIVLVQINTQYYTANFIDTNKIKINNNVNYNGIAIVTFKNQILLPVVSSNTLQNNKIIRYNKSKSDVVYSSFGIRYDDSELSLGVSNVENILCVRYSNTNKNDSNYTNTCFDNITIINASSFNVNDIVYNNNTKAKIIEISGNILYLVYFTNSHFIVDDNITDWNTQISSKVVSVYSGSYVDITENYKLIANTSNTIHDISKLKILNKNKLPVNDVIVVFDYYKTNIGDVTTVDSYDNRENSEIIDFRFFAKSPTINGLGNILSPFILTNGALNPSLREVKFKSVTSPNSIFKCDYSYYLGRKDLAIIDDTGVYKIINGVSADFPSAPEPPKECLILATININPYTENVNDVNIEPFKNQRYTMQDITNIDARITNVETEIALSKLENVAKSTILIDNNNTVRLKTGFVVDDFSNLTLSDSTNDLYRSSIDTDLKMLSPETNSENIELEIINGEFTKYKSLISLPYAESSFASQNKQNNIVGVNDANFINWEGILNTYPSANNWFVGETSHIKEDWFPLTTISSPEKNKKISAQKNNKTFLRQQTIKIDIFALKPNTKLNVFINSTKINDLIVPSTCNLIKDGTRGTNNKSFIVGERLLWQNINTRTIDGSRYQPSTVSRYTQSTVGAITGGYNSYTQSLNVVWDTGYNFELEDMKSGSYIIGETSGAIAILKNNDIITDDNGNFYGNIFIPNPNKTNYKFPTGELLFKAIGENTFAEYKFSCGGSTITDLKTITSIRLPENNDSNIDQEQITTSNISKIKSWNNPISQVFTNNEIGGCFLTSLELYFLSKDNYIPIIIQIRTVENDYPTETILPFSEISIDPKYINTSSDGTVSTKIQFKDIVYLKENTQYCISVLSNSNKYYLFSGVYGSLSLDTKTNITKNPNIGNFYQVQNTKNWVADKSQSLKFVLNKAKFETTGNIYFENIPKTKLINDAVTTTKNSNLVKIYCPNHGFHTQNNSLSLSGIQSGINPTILTNTIGDSQYNIPTTISVETPELIPTLINNLPISTTNVGYLKIDNEIISYIDVNNNTKLITIPVGGRGKNNSNIVQHTTNSVVEVYSFNGIPLTELNNTFNSIVPIDLDNFGVYTINNANFTNVGGGKFISIDINNQYETITPNISYKYFPSTTVTATLTATTATSISNNTTNEPTFLPYQKNIILNDNNILNTPLMIASGTKEELLNKSSLGLNITMQTNNENVSPIIDYDKCSVVITTNRINKTNNNELLPNTSDNAFIYLSKPISLILPSQAIVIIFDGIRNINHEIEVYAKIGREDNLPEFDKNNFILIPAILYPSDNNFAEFKYELRNMPQYKEFQIKIVGKSNSQANYPKIKNLRIISTAT